MLINPPFNLFPLHRALSVTAAALTFAAPRLAYCEDGAEKYFSWGALGLAGSMLILLAFLFFLVFRWSQRNEQASYLGVVYKDTVFEFEFSRRKSRVDQKRGDGEYLRAALTKDDWLKNNSDVTKPTFPAQLRKFVKGRRNTGTGGLGGSITPPGMPSRRPGGYTTIQDGWSEDPWEDSEAYGIDTTDMSDEEKNLYDNYQKDRKSYEKSRQEWYRRRDIKEEEFYYNQLDVVRTEAEEAATRAADVDISIFRGRGPAFVLEFTAVVVIIFSAVILGILGVLNSNQIGTLLAAIAGYVLGRSTTGTGDNQRPQKPEREPSENQAAEQRIPQEKAMTAN